MGDYTTAILAMVGVGILLTAAAVFALMRQRLPTIDMQLTGVIPF